MPVREALNKYPAAALGVIVLLLLITALAVSWSGSGSDENRIVLATQAYYTTDDGHTWFADDINRVTPFDHQGATAVQAFVFECDGGEPFVGYLQRLREGAAQQIREIEEKATAAGQEPDSYEMQRIRATSAEVKRPGEADWVPLTSTAASDIMNVQCPDGEAGKPRAVRP